MSDSHEPTHSSKYMELYSTGYDRSIPERPECPECQEYPAHLDPDTDEVLLCSRCEELV